ncbi:MAG: D-alanyl-D-alanine carboxypeptidase family protein [Rhodospirillaceae bacterium]
MREGSSLKKPGFWGRLGIAAVLAGWLGSHAASAEAGYASIIVDADTGRILHATNADTRNYPASLTKMMTLYIVFDALEVGKWTLNTRLTVSARAAGQAPSRLGLEAGSTIRVEDAILALVTKSANDVATTVAENLARSESDFAMMMTSVARKLNMSRTTFRNASGLPNGGQMSTARDMALLARALLQHHGKYYHYFSTKEFQYAGHTHQNHNKLLTTYNGADGIKTGYIRASGFNLAASVKRGGTRLIGVVFGGRDSRQRNRIMTKLLNKGFSVVDGRRKAPMVADKLPERETVVQSVVRQPPREIARAPSVPAPARPANPGGTAEEWAIQVGAYARYSQAYQAARTAMDMAAQLVGSGTVKVVPLKTRRGKTLYRARIHGIAKDTAYAACKLLTKKERDCMELRLTEMRVAENTH